MRFGKLNIFTAFIRDRFKRRNGFARIETKSPLPEKVFDDVCKHSGPVGGDGPTAQLLPNLALPCVSAGPDPVPTPPRDRDCGSDRHVRAVRVSRAGDVDCRQGDFFAGKHIKARIEAEHASGLGVERGKVQSENGRGTGSTDRGRAGAMIGPCGHLPAGADDPVSSPFQLDDAEAIITEAILVWRIMQDSFSQLDAVEDHLAPLIVAALEISGYPLTCLGNGSVNLAYHCCED